MNEDLEYLAQQIVRDYGEDLEMIDTVVNACEAFLDHVVEMELPEILQSENFIHQAGHLSPEQLEQLQKKFLPDAIREIIGFDALRQTERYPGLPDINESTKMKARDIILEMTSCAGIPCGIEPMTVVMPRAKYGKGTGDKPPVAKQVGKVRGSRKARPTPLGKGAK